MNSRPDAEDKDKVFLCNTWDIEENTARGFETRDTSVFVIKQKSQLYIYQNRCPHAGTELNWSPDVFLTSDRSLIICATHGALFLKESGLCVGGPCQGQSLETLPFSVEGDKVFLTTGFF